MLEYDLVSLNNDGNDLDFLRTAVENNRKGDVAYAVNMYSFDANCFPDGPGVPLCRAAELGLLGMCKELVAWGADIHVQPVGEFTPLILAAMKGHSAILQWLLDNGVDPHWIHYTPGSLEYGFPERLNAFDAACREEQWDVIEILHDSGATLSSLDIFPDMDRGTVFLSKVCRRGLLWLAISLLRSGVDPNDSPEEYPAPLIQAIMSGHLEIVECLVENGAIVDQYYEITDQWDQVTWAGTALTASLENKQLNIASYLLDAGADPDRFGIIGPSEMMRFFGFHQAEEIHPIFICIAERWNVLLAKMLAKCKPSDMVAIFDDAYHSPLSFAFKYRNFDAALMLIGFGWDINAELDGYSIVDYVIWDKNGEAAQLLVDNDLNLLQENCDGFLFVTLISVFPEHALTVANSLAKQLSNRYLLP